MPPFGSGPTRKAGQTSIGQVLQHTIHRPSLSEAVRYGHRIAKNRMAQQSPSFVQKAFFGLGKATREQVETKKDELLQYIATLDRGVRADDEDKSRVEQLARDLERLNPTKKPLSSPLVNDAENLTAANRETWPFFNQVTAAITPTSDDQVDVQFKQFKILGLIPVTAPASAKGTLSVTFLDEELRISRGDKGNLFVLVMDDRDQRP